MLNKIKILVQLAALSLLLTSCWTTSSAVRIEGDCPERHWVQEEVVNYNIYDEYKGMTKNEILQSLSVPDRTMSDGNKGEILIYENRTMVTNSSATASSSSNVSANGNTTYDHYGNVSENSQARANSQSGYASQTVTQEIKTYVNFFRNEKGLCYNVKANIGDMTKTKGHYVTAPGKCIKRTYSLKKPNKNILWLLCPPLTPYGIVAAIWYGVNKDKQKEKILQEEVVKELIEPKIEPSITKTTSR